MRNLESYSWTTEFKTSDNLMIHTFSERIQVVSNTKTGTAKVVRDGNVINTLENPSLTEYANFLLRTAKEADDLKKFNAES